MAQQLRVREPGRGKPFASRGDSSVPSGRMETNNPVAHRIVCGWLELPRQPRFAGRGKIGSSSILGRREINCYENPGTGLRQGGWGMGKGTSLNIASLAPRPFASSVYVHAP